MPISRGKSSYTPLFKKQEARLSAGAYALGALIEDANRSRYNERAGTLGMGFVEAVLSVLSGRVRSFAWQENGAVGHVTLASISNVGNEETYSWDERDPDEHHFGNFASGLTYKVAVLGIVCCYLDDYYHHSVQSSEVIERWRNLVQQMHVSFGSPTSASGGWSDATIAQACTVGEVRTHIERVCDALYFSQNYRLPGLPLRKKTLFIEADHLFACPLASPQATLSGRELLAVKAAPSPLAGAIVKRVASVLHSRRGPLLLVGPHGIGKSTIPLQLAIERGWSVEQVDLHPGWEAADLFGRPARLADGSTTFFPGPVTRWAQQVTEAVRLGKNQATMLLLDEYTRGHKSIQALLMSIMNQRTALQIEAMGLSVPADEQGSFYIVEVIDLQQRYVLPVRLAPIVVTTNIGASYTVDLTLQDPAFRSRFRGGYLHMGDYDDPQAAELLADKLNEVDPPLSSRAELVRAILAVRKRVKEYQETGVELASHLDPRTMISWGQATLTLLREADAASGSLLKEVFLEAALQTWIDMFCPLLGADLDETIKTQLIRFVKAEAPISLDSSQGR